jgi:hypothetical protein
VIQHGSAVTEGIPQTGITTDYYYSCSTGKGLTLPGCIALGCSGAPPTTVPCAKFVRNPVCTCMLQVAVQP